MRSEKFHAKSLKPVPVVVDECSRLTVHGTEPVNIYQVDDQGKKVALLETIHGKGKVRIKDCEQIIMESKGDFQSILEGPDPMDKTPLEVPVEQPLTQTQQLRMWLQNEQNMKQLANAEMSWEDFKDLGDMEEGDEFFSQFNPNMTKYEMQAEALRQENSPLRGNPITDEVNKRADNSEGNSSEDNQSQPNATTGESDGQSNNPD
jgi:hypothetical protein